jgi:hypothetical protein
MLMAARSSHDFACCALGAWEADKKHGQGKEYSSNGELAHEGYWISDAYFGPNAPDRKTGGQVKMDESGGIYQVPVLINDALRLNFIVDSGAPCTHKLGSVRRLRLCPLCQGCRIRDSASADVFS